MNSDRGDKKPSREKRELRKDFEKIPEKKTREQTVSEIDVSERIAKRLARAGIASRRDAEMMIAAGRIAVNGKVLSSPAFNVTRSDAITVDGKALPPIERTRLWLYHKPSGLVTTNRDPEGRPTVFENLPEGMPRVLSVGRLDINTEGLLLLTNDGGLARVLELPSTGWVRKYRVRAHGKVKQSDLDELKNGIAIDGIFYGSVEASIEREQGSNVWLSVALREGKNREVKNILGALGLSVTRLIRISFGPFQLSDLEEGAVRELKGRTLRDQLGERLIEEANADFDAPILKPFSNAPVAADTRLVERPVVSEDGWISSTEQSSNARNSGGRGKKGDFAERGRARMSTRPTDGPMGRSYSGGRGAPRGGAKEEEEKVERPAPRSRSTNVWMAPGARPQTASKKYRPREEGAYGDRKRDDKGEGSYENRERKPYGDKPKSYGERSVERGDKKPYRPREEGAFGDRKRDDKREGSYEKRERKPYGDKSKSYGERSGERGDKKPYRPREERVYGDRKRDDSRGNTYAKRDSSSSGEARGPHKEGGYAKKEGGSGNKNYAGRPSDGLRKSKPSGGPRADRRR